MLCSTVQQRELAGVPPGQLPNLPVYQVHRLCPGVGMHPAIAISSSNSCIWSKVYQGPRSQKNPWGMASFGGPYGWCGDRRFRSLDASRSGNFMFEVTRHPWLFLSGQHWCIKLLHLGLDGSMSSTYYRWFWQENSQLTSFEAASFKGFVHLCPAIALRNELLLQLVRCQRE